MVVYLCSLAALFDPDPFAAAVARCVDRVFARRREGAARGLAALSSRRPGVARVPREEQALAGRVARAFKRRPQPRSGVHGDLGSRRLGIVRG